MQNIKTKLLYLFKTYRGAEHYSMAAIAVTGAALFLMAIITGWGPYRGDSGDSLLYVLSAIVQALAATLALLVTLSLLATQLAAINFTPRLVTRRLTDKWLWSAVLLYLVAIGWALLVLSGKASWVQKWDLTAANIAIVLALTAFAYIVPFTVATLRSLQPEQIARWLLEDNDLDSLDEMM